MCSNFEKRGGTYRTKRFHFSHPTTGNVCFLSRSFLAFAAADQIRKSVFKIHPMLKAGAVSPAKGPPVTEPEMSNMPRFGHVSGDIWQYFAM
jgi:hypothetical protein